MWESEETFLQEFTTLHVVEAFGGHLAPGSMSIFNLPSVTFQPAAFLSGAAGPWAGHLPFAYDLTATFRPSLIVELGVFYGDSYFGLCQAVSENNIPCTCYGIDTWRGDPHGGQYETAVFEAVSRYNEQRYSSFSYLLRSEFDNALARFSEGSIDLLHIDGFHTYDAVRHDFENWFPKVRPGGVVLFHDVAVRLGDFGVWRFWEEIQHSHRTFTFRHSNGLGVLLKAGCPEKSNLLLKELFQASPEEQESIRRYYTSQASALEARFRVDSSAYASAGHSVFQIFYSQAADEQYSAERSFSQIVAAGEWRTVFERVPFGTGACSLRIDPANRPSVVGIRKILLRRSDGAIFWNWNPERPDEVRVGGTAAKLDSAEELRIFSYGDDPQIYLPQLQLSEQEHAVEVEVEIEIDLGFNAVRVLIERAEALNCKEQRLAEDKAALERLYESQAQAMREQIQQMQRLHLSAIGERERALGSVEDLRKQAQALNLEVERLRMTEEQLRTELSRVRNALQEEKNTRFLLQHSRSWKLTAPLRSAARIFKG